MLSLLKKQVVVKETGERGFVEQINDKIYFVRVPLLDSPYPKWLSIKLSDLEVPSFVESLPDAPF